MSRNYILHDRKIQVCTANKLEGLLSDPRKKIYGASYDNSLLSRRQLARANSAKIVEVEGGKIKTCMTLRVESAGILELENVLDMLIQSSSGDLPGYSHEELLREGEGSTEFGDLVSVNKHLYAVDLVTIFSDYSTYFQEFTIAGEKFTLLTVESQLDYEEDGEDLKKVTHSMTYLFGDTGSTYFFSKLLDKRLSKRDISTLINILLRGDIIGKAIVSARLETEGVSGTLYPLSGLISLYENTLGGLVLATDTGYLELDSKFLFQCQLEVELVNVSGSFALRFHKGKETLTIRTD